MTGWGLTMLPRSWRKNPALTFTFMAIVCVFVVVFAVSSGVDLSGISLPENDPVLDEERHALDDSMVHLQKDNARLEAELKYEKLKSEMLSRDLANAMKQSPPDDYKNSGPQDSDNKFNTMQAQRRAHIKNVCETPGRPLGFVRSLIRTMDGLTYCDVGRLDSTFWLQVFRYLDRDYEGQHIQSPLDIDKKQALERPFTKTRQVMWFKLKDPEKKEILDSTTFITVQDPLTHLWESYAQDFIMPKKWNPEGVRIEGKRLKPLNTVPKRSVRPCGSDITFAEFVNYAVTVHGLDYDTIYRQCDPCQLQPTYILKSETSQTDNHHMLKHVNLAWVLNSANLTDTKTMEFIKNTVTDNLLKFQEAVKNKCATPLELSKQFHHFFVVMGMIPEGVTPPKIDAFTKKNELINSIYNLYMVGKKKGLDMEAQKRKYLIKAYKTLSEAAMKSIREKYKIDFQLFEYNDAPADIFG